MVSGSIDGVYAGFPLNIIIVDIVDNIIYIRIPVLLYCVFIMGRVNVTTVDMVSFRWAFINIYTLIELD